VTATRDRLAALLDAANTTLNGIDYVEVASADQRTLRVHFYREIDLAGTLTGLAITGGESIPTVPVEQPVDVPVNWSLDAEGRRVLTVRTPTPGDFSTYTLEVASPAVDPYFARSRFSFKAGCPSTLDCKQEPPECPPEDGPHPPIDYLAKDFESFRKALSDFSAQRYPEWRERSEADFGTMFLEALAALADDLSYTQDRVAAEATLATATQRRSLVRHARLVDYEPRPATSARVLLQLDVGGGPIPPGVLVDAQGPDGARIVFETGTGLGDTTNYVVDAKWNRRGPNPLTPYFWDDSQRCLRRGATEMWIHGHDHQLLDGMTLLVDTEGETSADPPVRQLVRLTPSRAGLLDFATEELDPLLLENGAPAKVTHIRWRAEDALEADHDLTRTTVAGNIVPATQGRRYEESFAIPTNDPALPQPTVPPAVRRTGPNATPDEPVPEYLHPLRKVRLSWLADPDDPDADPAPEIELVQMPAPPATEVSTWKWRRKLLDAEPLEDAFTVDPAAYRAVRETAEGDVVVDYDGSGGDTIRFGDGVFGNVPDNGAVFRVRYRVGDGARGNVAADSITDVDPSAPVPILAVTNPFPAAGGKDEEPAERVRRLAPEKFRAVTYRAVRPEDYVAAAKTLPWVQTAGTVFRWTGSWLTVFTTADPRATDVLGPQRRAELIALLDRYRMAGYESYSPPPRYVPLDLTVTVCARADAFRGDVEKAVVAALDGRKVTAGRRGFFDPDNFVFGAPLERSRLEAAIQAAPGVGGVVSIQYVERGVTSQPTELGDVLSVARDQLVQLANDPSRPWKGSLKVIVKGGK
jgi:Baseplate J-like protein